MTTDSFSRFFPKAFDSEIIEPFFHKGDWAIHDVLPSLLSTITNADIYISTFSVSEDSLRPLFFLQEEKRIRSLNLLLDMTVKRHKLELLLFAANITPLIHINSVHAKVLLVENEQYRFGIVGSANMNVNARYEAGFYFTSKTHFDFFKNEYTKACAESILFEWI